MHHVGLPRSPFEQQHQRQHALASPTATSFGFSSPVFSHTFSPPARHGFLNSRAQDADLSTGVSSDSEALQDESSTSGISSAAEDLPETRGEFHERETILKRLYGLIARLEDEDYGFEDKSAGEVDSQIDRLELIVKESLRRSRQPDKQSKEVTGRERMTLDEIRKSEEDSYLGGVSPGALQQVRVKVERQPKAKQRRTDQAEVISEHGSRSSRWGHESSHVSNSSIDGVTDDESLVNKVEEITPQQATSLAKDAQDLSERLLATLAELQYRKTESDQIHDLLVQRCESSTERILLLEYRIAEMEDDFSANASELKFLRLQLQAIEAQCAPYMAMDNDEDAELGESIMNWKIDWEEVNRRSMARRGRKDVVVPARVVRGASAEVPLRRTYSQHGTTRTDGEDG